MKKIILFFLSICFLYACKSEQKENQSVVEQHRPQFHFTPKTGWMNDPNGMVYFKGEYHLFYQHYPDSTVWGPMHWGHAVSKDLVHWEHLPIALYPDSLGYIFSGSAVVDVNNTSGFGTDGEPPLVAIYTYHNMAGEKSGKTGFQTQGIAYSLDKGRTWTKYDHNPVVTNPNIKDFRDPKVMWHEAEKEWVMTLAVADHTEFYASKDLKDWSKTGEFGKTEGSHGGVWECPDMFPLKDDKGNEKWVLIVNVGNGAPNGGSGTQYFVGQFDGKTFKNDNKPSDMLWLEYGKDNYATVTWSDAPDNRRISIGWMSNWQYAQKVPTGTWRSACTLPRELSLKTTEQGARLIQKPVKEAEILRGSSSPISEQLITDFQAIGDSAVSKEIELSFDLSASKATEMGVVLSNSKNEKVKIGYDATTKQYFIDRTEGGKKDFSKDFVTGRQNAPRLSTNPIVKMHLFIDVASVELFADDGSCVMTAIYFPNEDFKTTKIFAQNGEIKLLNGQVWTLKNGNFK